MRASQKRKLKNAAKTGAYGVGSVINLILRSIGTVLLIGITTCMIVACIFLIYIKTDVMPNLQENSLEDFSLNLTSTIYYTDGNTGEPVELIQLTSSETRYWVDYEEIPLDFEHAVVAIEDQRFYRHNGVDWYRSAGAFVNMFLGMRNTFGGSTITQQLIKNMTQYDDVTVQRKLMEILSALEFENRYGKDDIIEGYLNLVYFGHSRYGIAAAADFYFGKELDQLSLAEITSIVGITNNPSIYSPYVSRENNKERQEIILTEMYKQGYISYEQCQTAKAETLIFQPYEGSAASTEVYSYYVDAVFEDAIEILMEERGVSYTIAEKLLYTGGFKIYTAMDKEIQDKVDSIYQDLEAIPVPRNNTTKQFQSAIVIMDHTNGNIVALAGGVGEKTSSRGLNRATMSKRAPGSSFKPIAVYAPAMEYGLITPETRFEDEQDIVLVGNPNWFPYNDDRENSGVVTIREALINSLNTISAQILDQLTPQASYNFLTSELGVKSLVEDDIAYAPLCLGQLTNGITVEEMCAAFCIFPNNGVYNEPRTITKICDSNDQLLYDNVSESHAAISEATAYWMTSMMQDAVNSGTGSGAKISNMPVAGKTGTSGKSKDRWFCGFTPYYTAAVWTGYDLPENISISFNPASRLFKNVMTLVHEDLETKKFTKPEDTYLTPVPGVDPAVTYYVRGVASVTTMTDFGILVTETVPLYDEEAGARSVGRTVTVTALEVEGYTLVGESEVQLTLTENLEENYVEFTYVPINTEPDPPVVDPNDPSLPTDPTDPGVTDPGTTDPGTSDPGTTEPGTTDPGTTDPGTSDPGTSEPQNQ